MKAKDLRERTVEDLRELEKSLSKDTFTHRFKNFTNRLDDTSVINKTRRDLARVKTIIRQSEQAKQAEAAKAAPAKSENE
jgi:large subunit ribosomal protein L29